MSDMPERIWAGHGYADSQSWVDFKPDLLVTTEYIRADVHEAEVRRLRIEVLHATGAFGDVQAENMALREWKESAMRELAAWDAVFKALGSPGALGASKAESALAEARLPKKAFSS